MSIISEDSVIIRQARNLKSMSLTSIASKVIDKNKKAILDAQRDQLRKGIRGDGAKITPDYSSATAKRKGFKTPNLYDTGDMYKNLDIQTGIPNDQAYTIYSDVDYFPKLNEKYDKAFELNEPAKKVPEINNEILAEYHKELNK